MALGRDHIDLASGLIHVERSWDMKEGFIPLKSKAGKRRVPISAVLRDHLVDRRLRRDDHHGLAFGGDKPFNPRQLAERADKAWEAGLNRIILHECRHTFASLMIAAGVDAKALSTYMGHANISITLDTYGHLMPGNEEEAAGLLDAYLERAAGEIRMQELNNELSIVGGTGKYKKARGDARLTRLDDQGAVQRVRLRIILSP